MAITPTAQLLQEPHPRRLPRALCSIVLLACVVCAAGCAGTPRPKQSLARASQHNPAEARRMVDQALWINADEPEHAFALFQEASQLDPDNAIARNNLGVHRLRRGELEAAAREFSAARQLLPRSPDPRLNLGMVYEAAGRTRDALDAYAAALELVPDSVACMQALARLRLRTGIADKGTPKLLEEISLRGTTQRWREWARLQLAKSAGREH